MKILYGTANPAKLKSMREMLQGLDIEIISLKDVSLKADEIDESGNEPLENAKIKALAYYKATKMPVFSCDSGLYIEGLDNEIQPGVHVRRVNGKVLTDEEMIEYYTGIASSLGGKVKAKYKNAICLILDEENIFEYDGEDICSVEFLISNKAHTKRNVGFPLNSISLEIKSERYYMDIEVDKDYEDEDRMIEGFRKFFINTVLKSSK